MRFRPLLSTATACLALACAPAPDLPTSQLSGDGHDTYPNLLPLSQLQSQAAGLGQITPRSEVAFAQRLAALRARAAQLSRPVVDNATRQRMNAAVTRAALR